MMPCWDYRCSHCWNVEEYEASIYTGPPLAGPCPVCGGLMKRVQSPVRWQRSSANAEETYNPSLGIAHRTDRQAAEHLKRVNDTEGTHYVLADPDDTRMV